MKAIEVASYITHYLKKKAEQEYYERNRKDDIAHLSEKWEFVKANYNLTQSKLHKLLFYLQGIHLSVRGGSLFDEDISAWKDGPVCEAVYNELDRKLGDKIKTIYVRGLKDKITDDQRDFIHTVLEVFAPISPTDLKVMCKHDAQHLKRQGLIIDKNSMAERFVSFKELFE